MKKLKKALQRPLAALAAFALVVGTLAPLLVSQFAAAAGQVQERAIKLSTAVAGATGVSYSVTFKPATTIASPDVILEFCADTPLLGANCTYNNGAGTNTVPIFTGSTSDNGTAAVVGGVPSIVKVTGGSNMTAGTAYTFTLSGVTNPSVTASFYARIYVYTTGGSSAYTAPASSGSAPTTGSYTDYGGVAMATVRTINITARVMESLSMCVSKDDLSNGNFPVSTAVASCAVSAAPDIEIGHGTPTKIIDNSAVDMTPAYFQLSTNAINGAVIRMKATKTCPEGGITTDVTGADCSRIPGINGSATAATPVAMTQGTAAFGLYVNPSQLTSGAATSTGTINPDSGYNDTTDPTVAKHFAMGTDASGVTSTYGDTIATCGGAVNQVVSQLYFAATASLTTPAGIYTGGESLIATGTF
jgi:hypothetical protein